MFQINTRLEFPSLLNKLNLSGNAIEIGVLDGSFSLFFLQNWKGNYYMLDIWDLYNKNKDLLGGLHALNSITHNNLNSCLLKTMFYKNAFLLKMPSNIGASIFPDNFFDFIYIDANHAYSSVKEDIELWFPKIKTKGIFGGHDYIDFNLLDKQIYSQFDDKNIIINNQLFGVNSAVDEFINNREYKLYLTKEQAWYQTWYIMNL